MVHLIIIDARENGIEAENENKNEVSGLYLGWG